MFILHLKQPDARVIGFFAWQRYAPIVPHGALRADQRGSERDRVPGLDLMLGYEPNDRIEYVRNARQSQGQPYLNSTQLKILGDEQARVAALGRAIDGATLTVEVARSFNNDRNVTVLTRPNAAFRELQMTIKRGQTAVARPACAWPSTMRSTVRTSSGGCGGGEAEYSVRSAGVRPVASPDKEAKDKAYLEVRSPFARGS